MKQVKLSEVVYSESSIEELRRLLAVEEDDDEYGEDEGVGLEFPWPLVIKSTKVSYNDQGNALVDIVLGFDDVEGAVDYEIRLSKVPTVSQAWSTSVDPHYADPILISNEEIYAVSVQSGSYGVDDGGLYWMEKTGTGMTLKYCSLTIDEEGDPSTSAPLASVGTTYTLWTDTDCVMGQNELFIDQGSPSLHEPATVVFQKHSSTESSTVIITHSRNSDTILDSNEYFTQALRAPDGDPVIKSYVLRPVFSTNSPSSTMEVLLIARGRQGSVVGDDDGIDFYYCKIAYPSGIQTMSSALLSLSHGSDAPYDDIFFIATQGNSAAVGVGVQGLDATGSPVSDPKQSNGQKIIRLDISDGNSISHIDTVTWAQSSGTTTAGFARSNNSLTGADLVPTIGFGSDAGRLGYSAVYNDSGAPNFDGSFITAEADTWDLPNNPVESGRGYASLATAYFRRDEPSLVLSPSDPIIVHNGDTDARFTFWGRETQLSDTALVSRSAILAANSYDSEYYTYNVAAVAAIATDGTDVPSPGPRFLRLIVRRPDPLGY